MIQSGRSARKPNILSEIGMLNTVEITNFRGFEHLKVSDLALINVIVGDNAVGKTALLEAMFLTLSGHADKPLALKQWRGMDTTFRTGSVDSIFEGIYADLFHDPNSQLPITIKLTGQGFENRQLVVEKSRGDVTIPLERPKNRHQRRAEKAGWPAPGLDDTQLGEPSLPLELHRAQIADRRVPSL